MKDVHSHFIPKEALLWLEQHQHLVSVRREQLTDDRPDVLIINDTWPFSLSEAFIDENQHAAAQRKAQIDHTLVSPLPQLFLYNTDPAITSEFAAVYNQGLIDMMKRSNTRYSGLSTVPLNDPIKAASELKSTMKKGLLGSIIGTGIDGTLLTDERYIPFWEEANRQKAIIFIHPLLSQDKRMNKGKMSTLMGVLWETTVCAADLLLQGYLDVYPNVRILLAHGGGFLPYQIGRMSKGYQQWESVSKNLSASPGDYLRKFWFDSVLWNDDALSFLVKLAGEDRVVPGSDFPFELKDFPPINKNLSGWDSLIS
ncbi:MULTISPECIES: amidohydrolase family protein [Neobacillus]|uniref:Amidohydrolase n=1 Tax=Neobacillus citreus TaxID=2833578 RepID=A0A942T5I8_9BACI|nr:amidohydrolase family protein [Neobacillus citreus]MCH6264242.1 amidohydrolase [Neobacillus citreus]